MRHFARLRYFTTVILGFALSAGAQNPNPDSQGQVAPELAGKWCYYNLANGDEGKASSTCVTLNEDGSYEFYVDSSILSKTNGLFPGAVGGETDYGTWSVQGNTLYYNSQARGQGSFQFQKMNQPTDKTIPMIVMGGLAFVASTPHDPW